MSYARANTLTSHVHLGERPPSLLIIARVPWPVNARFSRVLAKASLRSFASFARPRAKLFVRMNGQPLDEELVSGIVGYFGMWFLIAGTGTLCMSALGIEPVTAATSVLATLNNIGPGLAMVGPTESFGWMPDLGKLLACVLMLIGRLEFYAVVVLFLPRFWRI